MGCDHAKPHPPQFNLLEVTKHLHIVLSLLIAFSSARGAVGAGGHVRSVGTRECVQPVSSQSFSISCVVVRTGAAEAGAVSWGLSGKVEELLYTRVKGSR